MARTISSSFTWTTEELRTKTGLLVGPASSNPDAAELSFLVVRMDDDRSSRLCKDIERMANSNGGIVFRGSASIVDSSISAGMTGGYHTGLFHDNCRCRLLIKPNAFYGEIDELDFMMAASSSAISYNQQYRAKQNLEAPVQKRAENFEYKASIQRIISSNLATRRGF
jgi:hypothetical protein